jgi:hypothetical protein
MSNGEAGATKRICRDLGLPIGNPYTQEWAYELPEEYRSRECFDCYVTAYSTPTYGRVEKHVLMQLILDVANDLSQSKEGLEDNAWERVVALLQADRSLHSDLIDYWSLTGEPLEDAFSLTPKMRAVRESA